MFLTNQQSDTDHFCTVQPCNATMPRRLEWIKSQDFQGFGCSECNWKFNATGALAGNSLDEMKRRYEAERDKAFTAHVCLKWPSAREPKKV
jgi:hypothetical protein